MNNLQVATITKTVLFVCIGNSGRSQMAEAFLDKLSKTFLHTHSLEYARKNLKKIFGSPE